MNVPPDRQYVIFRPETALHLPAQINVLDSIGVSGPQLVTLPPGEARLLRITRPDLKILKRVDYRLALVEPPRIRHAPKLAGSIVPLKLQVTITSAADGSPVAGARLLAFTNFTQGDGEEEFTDERGVAIFRLGGSSKKLDRLYILPKHSFWPRLESAFVIRNNAQLTLTPLDLSTIDSLRFFYPAAPLTAGANVRIAVIDSGVAPHKDLYIESAVNAVPTENAADTTDASPEGHGTHVCGIIAARGAAPDGVRGLAPSASLLVYRVVEQGADSAANFAIAKAINLALDAHVDLINISIAGTEIDPLVHQAIEKARTAGTVIIAASGNDNRKPVSFPASESFVLAVSALGRKGTFPANAAQSATVLQPFAADPDTFLADFSNIGEDVDFIAPGVGVISTVPGGYAALDGTSMSCPAVTGACARLLSAAPDVLSMPRDAARAEAVLRVLLHSASTLGFQPDCEGHGLLRI